MNYSIQSIPGKDSCTEFELHFSPLARKDGDNEAKLPKQPRLGEAEPRD